MQTDLLTSTHLMVLLLVSKERSDLAALGKSETIRTQDAPNETNGGMRAREEKRKKEEERGRETKRPGIGRMTDRENPQFL